MGPKSEMFARKAYDDAGAVAGDPAGTFELADFTVDLEALDQPGRCSPDGAGRAGGRHRDGAG